MAGVEIRDFSSPDETRTPGSCQVEHIGYVVSGGLHATQEDGSEGEVKPGDVYRIAPGHDAWVIGDEPAVFVELQGAVKYAKPS